MKSSWIDMDEFLQLYEQCALYKAKVNEEESDFTTNLLQYGITEDYFLRLSRAVELLVRFYDAKLTTTAVRTAVGRRLNHNHADNVKFCLLIDVLRCYDGLNHPTTFATPEGIALMFLLDKIIGESKIVAYRQLASVGSATLSLIDLVPYLTACSEQLGATCSLFLPTVFGQKYLQLERLYRRILYNLCKTIAEVDGVLSMAEDEWLSEIALLHDEDPGNDIDISNL